MHVFVDRAERRPRDIPERVRAALERLALGTLPSCSAVRRAALIALAAGALLAACGNGSGSQASSSPAATDESPTATAEPRRAAEVDRALRPPVYVTSPPGDARHLFVVEQGGTHPGRPRRQEARAAVPRHPLAGHRRRRAGPAVDGLRARLRAQRAASTSTTPTRDGDERVVEYQRASADARRPRLGARSCCAMAEPEANHNGGLLLFGPDKLLYIGTGDGGGGGDQHGARGNAQNLGTLLGKILRIDPQQSGGTAVHDPRRQPVRGPRAARAARSTATACATRGASRSTARPATSSIGDVGQDAVEEIDFVRRGKGAGANFGWRVFEGRSRYTPGETRAGRGQAGDHAQPLRRQLLDHRRRRGARPGAAGAARALRVRRLLPRRDPVGQAAARASATRVRNTSLKVDQPVLVRRGRARARLRASRSTGRSTVSSRDERRGLDGSTSRACAPRTRARYTLIGHQHLGGRPRPGVGGRPRAGRSPRTSTRSRPRSRRAAAPAGSRSRTTTPTTPRALLALRERLGRPPVARAATPPTCGSATATRSARSRSLAVPGHAADHLVVRRRPGARFTGDAVLGEGSVFVSRAACGEYLDGAAAPARARRCACICPGHGADGVATRAPSSTSTSPTGRARAQAARRARGRRCAARTSCSTPPGPTRPPAAAAGRRRSRCARTWRSCEATRAGWRLGRRRRSRQRRARRRSGVVPRRLGVVEDRAQRVADGAHARPRRARARSPRARARPRC